MFVSQTVMGYLDRAGYEFDLVKHGHSATSAQSARRAHIDPGHVAKAVLVQDESDYVLAVIPASRRLNRWALETLIDASTVQLADEETMPYVFRDCERGALPAVGAAFGIRTAIDDELLTAADVYFEAGDHEHLVHMHGPHFARMMADQLHGKIGY